MARSARGVNADSALEAVLRLKPKSYEYRAGVTHEGSPLPAGLQFGFLAQEVKRVLPALVADVDVQRAGRPSRQRKYIGIDYVGMIPVLVAAVQEQQAMIETLRRALGGGDERPMPRSRRSQR